MSHTAASNSAPARKLLRWICAAVLLFLAAVTARAEDIDIFASPPASNDLPNVIILWDNSANWSASIPVDNCSYADGSGGPKPTSPNKEQGAKMAIEKCAIYNVVHALPTLPNGDALFNVALMLFNESPASNSGGYPRRQFLPMTAANKDALKSTIAGITINGDKGNNAAFAKSLHEAYLMFAKAAPYRGTAGSKYDTAAVAGGSYVGPPGGGCGKNHIIFVANGGPGENTNAEALELLRSAGGDVTPLVYPTSYITHSDQGNWADEFTRFLRKTDVSTRDGVQSITTHAIAVTGAASDGLYPNFIRAMANQGGGQYYSASDVGSLTQYLVNIFNAIQASNSVFASASLPVSVNAQGTYKNQVFVGVFRPDANARPRWYGNLKQYSFNFDPATNTLQLADTLGFPALNAATGFFAPTAVSAWTQESAFWINDLKGTPPSASDRPDGPIVEKGGAAQMLRTVYASDQSTRRVYTCLGCPGGTALATTAAAAFVSTNAALTAAMLGVESSERTALINWIRGSDNRGDELGPGEPTTVRPSIHGDVLHSRPAVVDYGGSRGTVVFYGGNDGMLHAIDGNLTGTTAGQELWSFVPQELLARFKRLRNNLPEIRFPTTPETALATPRDYMVDGPMTVYQKLTSSGAIERVMLYASLRRGGRLIYAFDVTDPAAPRFVWKKTTEAAAVLGQTWSEPRVARVKGSANPVLILGAGYDAAAEDPVVPGATSMGNAVLVLDAMTGATLKSLSTLRSVPASVTLLDTDFDGFIDRAYAVDLGANVYRIDFETALGDGAPVGWTISQFAALANAPNTRKFFYEADAVQTAQFTAVLVGSGNRERPLLTSGSDRFYTLFDYSTGKGAPGQPAILDAQLVSNENFVPTGTPAGCYLAMSTAGEKVVTATVSVGGYSYFATNMPTPPSANSCGSNLGLAKTYQVPLFCGMPNTQELAGGGLPPTPVTGYVDVTIPDPNNPGDTTTKTVPFIIGGINSALSGIGASRVPINVDPTRRRTFWFTNQGH